MDFMYLWGPFAFFLLFVGMMVWAEMATKRGYDEIRRDKRMDSALNKISNMRSMT